MDYSKYLEFIETMYSTDFYETKYEYAEMQKLKSVLRNVLEDYEDGEEIMGLSAAQLGIPVNAIYIKYDKLPHNGELFLTQADIQQIKDKPRSFMMKLSRCPSSPTPYNIGIYNREFVVVSDNTPPIELFPYANVAKLDPNFDFCANIQRIIFSSQGIIVGDPTGMPINYLRINETFERNSKLFSGFNCYISPQEIEKIAERYRIPGNLSLAKEGAQYFIENLIQLLSNNINKDIIRIPPVGMFTKDAICKYNGFSDEIN
ncbi:hypothetical protein HN747_05065 [archaeon]|nr:hypothetical protein [archaeon]